MTEYDNEFFAPAASCTKTPNRFDHPMAEGVPEIAPVELLRLKPVGRAPVAILQVYGGVPPLADNVAL